MSRWCWRDGWSTLQLIARCRWSIDIYQGAVKISLLEYYDDFMEEATICGAAGVLLWDWLPDVDGASGFTWGAVKLSLLECLDKLEGFNDPRLDPEALVASETLERLDDCCSCFCCCFVCSGCCWWTGEVIDELFISSYSSRICSKFQSRLSCLSFLSLNLW